MEENIGLISFATPYAEKAGKRRGKNKKGMSLKHPIESGILIGQFIKSKTEPTAAGRPIS
jgi:hypothetical protein